jgi:glycosyltransferase involved in cell wall biosynthesis
MQNSPKISIITPSYNQGHFIEETILSILNQNYQNLEYIIIDGGSTDNTVEIIKKYQDKIHYWVSEKDDGQTHAINKGFKLANGDIIGWVNSDDLLVENGLNNLIKGFEQYKDADFIHGQSIILKENGNRELLYPENFPNLTLEYFGSFPFFQPASFFKRAILERTGYLDESFYSTMDFDFFLRIALNFSVHFIDLPIALFREQKDAKTYRYNDIWAYERNRVISKLIRSIDNADIDGIDLLTKMGLYVYDDNEYPVSKEFSKKEVETIIAIFVRDSIGLNFHADRFKEAYKIATKMKAILPEYFSDKIAFIHGRSKYYRFKIIHLLTRPLSKLK